MKTFDQIRKEINVYSAVDDNRMKVLHEKVLETSHIPASIVTGKQIGRAHV